MKYSNIDDIMNVFELEVDNIKEDRNKKGALLLLIDYNGTRNKNIILRQSMTSKYYIILEHYGNPEAIFDIEVKLKQGNLSIIRQCYSFSKNELLIIPDIGYFDVLEVKYTTIIGEKMLFIYNRFDNRFILKSVGKDKAGIDET